MVYINEESNVSSRKIRMLYWSIMLSLMLVGARVFALSYNPNQQILDVWGALVGIIAFFSPMSGVALSIGNISVSLNDNLLFGLSVGQIAGASAAARMFIQLTTHQIKRGYVWRASHLAIFGIVLTVMLSATFSYDPQPLNPLRKLALIMLLYLTIHVYFDTFDKLLFLQYTIVIIAGLAAAWTIQQGVSTSFPATLEGRQLGGLTGNPNYQAIYLASAIPMVFGVVMYLKPSVWRILAVCAGILIVVGVVITASRGGLLVLGISFMLSVMVWGPRRKGLQVLIGVLLIATFVGYSYSEYTQTRVNGLLNNLNGGNFQAESRARLFNDSFNLWSRYPVLGVGPDNWLLAVGQLDNRQSGAESPHVWPMQILAELGIIGILGYIAFTFFCIVDYQTAIRDLDHQVSLYSNLIKGFFVAALVLSLAWTSGNPYNQLWFELLLIGGISLGIISNQQDQVALSPSEENRQ